MGLSQRKTKQRIGPDPRNLTWGDDAARFGQAYLEKLGWSSGAGLGASGDGRASHITVKQKLNMLGIGADGAGMSADPMIAWKQGKDFDGVLARLNAASAEPKSQPADDAGDEAKGVESERKKRKQDAGADESDRKRKKSRLSDTEEQDGDSKNDKAKRKEEKRRRKEEKRAAAAAAVLLDTSDIVPQPTPAQEEAPTAAAPAPYAGIPMHRAHRSKFLRSKRLANGDETAMNQILGIASSDVSTPDVSTPTVEEPVAEPAKPSTVLGIDDGLIKTNTISVADYFKSKLAAKGLSTAAGSSSTTTAVATPVESTPATPPAPSPSPPPVDVEDEQPEIDEAAERKRRKKERKEKKRQKQLEAAGTAMDESP